jgi:hypothetical protein
MYRLDNIIRRSYGEGNPAAAVAGRRFLVVTGISIS